MKMSGKKIGLGLSVKFIISITVLLITGISVLSIYFANHEKQILHETLKERGLALANNLAYNSEYGILTANNAILSGFGEGIMKQPDVAYCIIQDINGRKIVSMKNITGFTVPEHIVRTVQEMQEPITQYFKIRGQDYYEISVRVTTGIKASIESEELLFQEEQEITQKSLGVVRVGISLARVSTLFKQTQRMIFSVGIIITLLAVIMVILLTRAVLAPIGKLVEATQEIAEGNLDYVVAVKTSDEIGLLAQSFNQMTEDLRHTTTSIDNLNKEIAERKHAEEEREKLEVQIRHSQKLESIGTMANGIAHNFNNILASIRGLIDMVLMDVSPDSRISSDLKRAIRGIEDAKELSRNILLFSSKEEQEFKPIRIHSVVKDGLELFAASMTTPIEISEHINSKCGPVLANKNDIKQVTMNLCTNAYHAMEKSGGVLKISLDEIEVDDKMAKKHSNMHKGKYVQLTVSDTGCGMDYSTVDRIFEPFFTTKEVGKGTGLGLSVIHGIVMNHKGEITVDSQPGKGTIFKVYLPLAGSGIQRKVEG